MSISDTEPAQSDRLKGKRHSLVIIGYRITKSSSGHLRDFNYVIILLIFTQPGRKDRFTSEERDGGWDRNQHE